MRLEMQKFIRTSAMDSLIVLGDLLAEHLRKRSNDYPANSKMSVEIEFHLSRVEATAYFETDEVTINFRLANDGEWLVTSIGSRPFF